MSSERQVFGRQGESDAADQALRRGYALIRRNYRTPYGEIDLILRSPEGELVFAEVKSRHGTFFGYPESAVDSRKREHIIRSALCYLSTNYPDDEDIVWRIDIIAIIYASDRKTILDFKWYEDVTADD
ncbi:MAG: YraN family protein [Anaerolineaceae bacterium]|nr:YraN family protein [Anaerolineaceae bacterium]